MELMGAWASTLPYPAEDGRHPTVGAPCAVVECPEPLRANEEVYRVVEMPDDSWVCWRHVARESGGPRPVTVPDPCPDCDCCTAAEACPPGECPLAGCPCGED